jgi:hypothetical protein
VSSSHDDLPRVRANALSAAVFVPLSEVDPRVVEPLLDSLEDAGVAAYAEPQQGAAERLWVDGERRELADAVLAAELPGLLAELEPDEDRIFAEIVANWDAEPEERPSWPVTEDVVTADPPADPGSVVWRASETELLPALEGDLDPDDGHYVPPPPPPLPPAQMATKFAVASIVLGTICLLGLQRLLGFPTGNGAYVFGALAVAAGIGTLVVRMRDTPPVDDEPDDGAQV